jgi:hypothetical protein
LILEIARLGDLEAAALRALWPAWFGRPAPPRMQRATLALALAHRIQSATRPSLSRDSARTLDAIADQEFGRSGRRIADPPRRLKPGTKLVREWRGAVHDVAVVDDGFLWNGTRHRSLSAIARAITGTRWNGLVFFGLKRAKRPPPSPATRAATITEAADV